MKMKTRGRVRVKGRNLYSNTVKGGAVENIDAALDSLIYEIQHTTTPVVQTIAEIAEDIENADTEKDKSELIDELSGVVDDITENDNVSKTVKDAETVLANSILKLPPKKIKAMRNSLLQRIIDDVTSFVKGRYNVSVTGRICREIINARLKKVRAQRRSKTPHAEIDMKAIIQQEVQRSDMINVVRFVTMSAIVITGISAFLNSPHSLDTWVSAGIDNGLNYIVR